MKPCLADVNFLLALLVRAHPHHAAAVAWWSLQGPSSLGLCRFAQLGVVRLLSNQKVMQGGAIASRAAWDLTAELLSDERVDFWPEPGGLEDALPRLLRYATPTSAIVFDAYLAAFALSKNVRIVTFDHGFHQFHGLEVEPLR